eukprot:16442666-Heterocapsa_arctica.AAC.1
MSDPWGLSALDESDQGGGDDPWQASDEESDHAPAVQRGRPASTAPASHVRAPACSLDKAKRAYIANHTGARNLPSSGETLAFLRQVGKGLHQKVVQAIQRERIRRSEAIDALLEVVVGSEPRRSMPAIAEAQLLGANRR